MENRFEKEDLETRNPSLDRKMAPGLEPRKFNYLDNKQTGQEWGCRVRTMHYN